MTTFDVIKTIIEAALSLQLIDAIENGPVIAFENQASLAYRSIKFTAIFAIVSVLLFNLLLR